MTRKIKIGVLGPNSVDDAQYALGRSVGECIARAGAVLFCGGLGGMMAAACEGARAAGGLTVGILPGADSDEANAFVDLAIPTALGPLRNAVLVRACDAVIAVNGAYGTLSEIAFALRLEVPVVGIDTWSLARGGRTDEGIHVALDPQDAVEQAIRLVKM